MFACPSFRVNIRNAPLTSCDLVMSRTCLSLSASVISFSVDNIPNESSTNIQGLRSSVGVFKYISVAFKALLRKSSIVTTLTTTTRVRSIPRLARRDLLTAASVSKYRQYPSGLESRKFLTTAREKKVFPVEDSPAMAVILFPDTPPNILPETSPLKMYEPVSTYDSDSSMSAASWV